MKNHKLLYAVTFLVAVALGAGVLALYNDIAHKKEESKTYPLMLTKLATQSRLLKNGVKISRLISTTSKKWSIKATKIQTEPS